MFPKDKQKSGKAINSEDPQYDLEVRQWQFHPIAQGYTRLHNY